MIKSFLLIALLTIATGCNPFAPLSGSSGELGSCKGSVTLTWDAPRDADNNIFNSVTGYNVYNGPAPRTYNQVRDSQTATPLDATQVYEVTDLELNQTHYFAVTAYNTAGESGYSNEVSKTLTYCGQNIAITLSWKAKK